MTDARLTTHVLDLTTGLPAAGMAITLTRLGADGPGEVVAEAVTNADGRVDEPLLAGSALVPGRYELAFAVGDHFASTTVPAPPAGEAPAHDEVGDAAVPFLDVVPIRFGVAPGTTHLHVPLLVTPFAYSTYRGS